MNTAFLKKYINVQNIIKDYTDMEFTAMFRHKMVGKKIVGRPGKEKEKDIDFTDEEKEKILKGLEAFIVDLKKS